VEHRTIRTRHPWRRNVVALIAALGVVAAAVYATNANAPKPQPINNVAAAQTAAPASANPSVIAGVSDAITALIQDVSQPAQQSPGDPNPLPGIVKKATDLLKQYGIDPTGTEKFLEQVAAATTPQQLTDDAKAFLVQGGVAANDIGEVQALLEQVGQVPANPSVIKQIVTGLLAVAAKYWWVFPIIVVVAVAAIIFGSASKGGQKDKNKATVSLFKAPSQGMGATWYKQGFRASDFPGKPGEVPDGFAYFALDRAIADEYAKSYGEGVIEVQIPSDEYDAKFKKFQYPYDGGPLIEVPIPADMVEQLNVYPRVWHR
jgi:hypothetical protein